MIHGVFIVCAIKLAFPPELFIKNLENDDIPIKILDRFFLPFVFSFQIFTTRTHTYEFIRIFSIWFDTIAFYRNKVKGHMKCSSIFETFTRNKSYLLSIFWADFIVQIISKNTYNYGNILHMTRLQRQNIQNNEHKRDRFFRTMLNNQ